MALSPYRISPPLISRYVWVNTPDTKFNADGLFKFDGIGSDHAAIDFKATIDKAAEDAFEDATKDMTPAEKKKWSIFLPYDEEEDDAGNPTGRIIFKFRQNAVIKVEGEDKSIRIAIFDSQNNPTAVKVYGGSTLRASYKMRPIKLASAKKIGVRLDFLKVQVLKIADAAGGGGSSGFDTYEGGFVDDHTEKAEETKTDAATRFVPTDSADY